MACVCRRYNARSDWLIVPELGRLRACARTIGRKVITSAALALAFFLYFCVPYNKQLNNLGQYGEASVLDFPLIHSRLLIK